MKLKKVDIAQAILEYPLPDYVIWYRMKFPVMTYIITGVCIIALGIILTVLTTSKASISIPTFITCGMLLVASVLHITAWVLTRQTEKKRAEYLGISIGEYLTLTN